MIGCGKKIGKRTCGKMFGGYMQLCSSCKIMAAIEYPQGYKYRPGDVCQHGVYVGGIGVDYMCGRCESGE